MNIIELAKECGVVEFRRGGIPNEKGTLFFTPNELNAFANAIVEEVEKELRSKFVGIADVIDVVRDMKVKGQP